MNLAEDKRGRILEYCGFCGSPFRENTHELHKKEPNGWFNSRVIGWFGLHARCERAILNLKEKKYKETQTYVTSR